MKFSTSCLFTILLLHMVKAQIHNANNDTIPSGATATNCLIPWTSGTGRSGCQQCLPGFFSTTPNGISYDCESCLVSCEKCSEVTKCEKCFKYHVLSDEQKKCTSCPQNCENCSDPLTCTSCGKGRFKDTQGACISCPVNCESCSRTNYCETCSKGFFRNSNGFCDKCRAGCEVCLNIKTCQICHRDFNLKGNGECIDKEVDGQGFGKWWHWILVILGALILLGICAYYCSKAKRRNQSEIYPPHGRPSYNTHGYNGYEMSYGSRAAGVNLHPKEVSQHYLPGPDDQFRQEDQGNQRNFITGYREKRDPSW